VVRLSAGVRDAPSTAVGAEVQPAGEPQQLDLLAVLIALLGVIVAFWAAVPMA
jgi:hypothetical protein